MQMWSAGFARHYKPDLPKIIEVCKFQKSIPICEELAVTPVIHVSLYSFRGVEGLPPLIAPQANLPHTNFLSWKSKLRKKIWKQLFAARLGLTVDVHNSKNSHQVADFHKIGRSLNPRLRRSPKLMPPNNVVFCHSKGKNDWTYPNI